MLKRTMVFLFGVAATVPFLHAQNDMRPLSERVEVRVINVDVTVTDGHGNPVTDLKREDFTVLEDGKPQKISNFDVITRTTAVAVNTPAPSGAPTAPQHASRRIALLVDNNYIDKVQRDAAIDKIATFIDDPANLDAEWSVSAVGQRLEMLQPFTANRADLHKALAALKNMPAFTDRSDMDRSILSDSVRRNERSPNADGAAVGQARTQYAQSVRFQAREQTWRTLRAVTNTARAVAELSHTYADVDGRKAIVLLTGGMETNTTFSAYDTGFDREIQQTKLEIVQMIDSIVHEANASNFAVFVLNAKTRGMIAPQHDVSNKQSSTGPNVWRTGGGNEPIDTTDVDSSSLTIALGTGGAYLTSNRLNDSLVTIQERTGNYYSLGYTPVSHDSASYHRISVKVNRPGVRVDYRQGYVDRNDEEKLELALRARFAADQQRGTLPVAVEVGKQTTRGDGDEVSIPVTASLPLQSVAMVPLDGVYAGRVHVYVSVFDKQGNNIGFSHKVQDVKLSPSDFERADQFRYTVKVRTHKGAYKVLVTLRDDVTNELGSAVESVQI